MWPVRNRYDSLRPANVEPTPPTLGKSRVDLAAENRITELAANNNKNNANGFEIDLRRELRIRVTSIKTAQHLHSRKMYVRQSVNLTGVTCFIRIGYDDFSYPKTLGRKKWIKKTHKFKTTPKKFDF